MLIAAAGAAGAQEWLKDRQTTAGPGIQVGESLVLHLGLGLEAGYDTNSLYLASDPDPSVRLRITPYLDLGTRRPSEQQGTPQGAATAAPKAQFNLGFATYYDHHFPVGGADDDQVNRINGLNALGIDTKLHLVVFPDGKFSFLTDLSYLRTQQAYESAEDAGRSRHDIVPGIGVRFRPGGGTLSVETGYRLMLMLFEDESVGNQVNRHAHEVRAITTWKVFPKTALVSRITFTPTFYLADESAKESSLPVRSLFGIQGLVLNRFGILLLAGYGVSNYERGPDFSSVIAQAELMFFVSPTAKVKVGGERDFVDSFYANYYVKTGGYAAYEQLFGGLLLGTIRFDASGRQYAHYTLATSDGLGTPSFTDRVDTWIGATLTLEYRATAWLSVIASARYAADITDFGYYYDDPSTTETEAAFVGSEFQKFEAFLGMKGHY